MPDTFPEIHIEYPDWVARIDWARAYRTDEEKMGLAVEVSRLNVLRDSGGPFGAAVFEAESGRLVSVGMNMVVPSNNSALHGEIVAFMMAQKRLGAYSLRAPHLPQHELATSCEPCAMCLGATLWSGVTRVLCGATRDDAQRLQFDEGPVFPESYAYLEERGIEFAFEVCREEAVEVMDLYLRRSGEIYNA